MTAARGRIDVLSLATLIEAAQKSGRDLRLDARAPESGGMVVIVFRQGHPTMVFAPGDSRSLGELLVAAGAISLATLTELLQERRNVTTSLEELVLERTGLDAGLIRGLLSFQARLRVLEALSWDSGTFELEECEGGGETGFHLDLPPVNSLIVRAGRRRMNLDRLLPLLPGKPLNLVVRRRRGGGRVPMADPLEARILAALGQPLVYPQLEARLMVDDDLVLEALLRLAAARLVALEPRVRLAGGSSAVATSDPFLASLVEETLGRLRSDDQSSTKDALWLLVLASDAVDAEKFVHKLGGVETGSQDDETGPTGLAAVQIQLSRSARVCLQSARLEAMLRGTRNAILSRCDAILLVRNSDCPEEEARLEELRALAVAVASPAKRPVLGIDLGATLRSWRSFPDAVVGLRNWQDPPSGWILARVLEGLRNVVVATSSQRGSRVT
jgi:hypothetical protein